MSAVQWLVKCGAGAIILLIACGFATARFGGGLQMPATTTRDGTLITLNCFMREPVPDVVLVGSSITFRLKEEYFATPRLEESRACGRLSRHRAGDRCEPAKLPELILVETNVLARTTDGAVVERYSRGDIDQLFFRPVRAAVAAYEQRRHAPLTHEEVALNLRKLVEQPPSDFDSRVYVDRALEQFNAQDPAGATRINAKRIEELIRTLEQRGARVLLFELPYAEPVESSRFVTTTREIIHARFPDPHRWLRIDANRSELRWADGVHLDERSAVIVTQALERSLASVRAKK